jgi:hypothetical protein
VELTVPLDLRTLTHGTGSVLITPGSHPAPGWQTAGSHAWHRLEVRGRTLWVGPEGDPVAASDGDLLLLALLGLTDLLQGHGDASDLVTGGLWGEPLQAAHQALSRLSTALDEVGSWPDWVHPTRASPSDPEKRVLVLTPEHVPGGAAKLAELDRASWLDMPFLFYTRAQKDQLRTLTREDLPASRPAEDKAPARAVGAWLIQELEQSLVANLAFPDNELRVYKKQLFGRTTVEAFKVLLQHDYHPTFLGPSGVAYTLRDGATEVSARLAAAREALEQADRDSPTELDPPTPLPRVTELGPPPPKVEGGRPSLRLVWSAVSPADLHASWAFGDCATEDTIPGTHLRVNEPSIAAVTLKKNTAFLPLKSPYTAIEIRLGAGADHPGEVRLLTNRDARQRGWDERLQCYRSLRMRPFHDVTYGPTPGHREWHGASKVGGKPAFIGEELVLPKRFQFISQLSDDLLDGLVGHCVYVYGDLETMEFRLVWQHE